jgi:hypothetical protein
VLRRLAEYALAVVTVPLLAVLHGQLNPVTDVLAFLSVLIAAAVVVSLLAAKAARHARQAAAAIAAA